MNNNSNINKENIENKKKIVKHTRKPKNSEIKTQYNNLSNEEKINDIVKSYLHQLGQGNLLNKDEEYTLAQTIVEHREKEYLPPKKITVTYYNDDGKKCEEVQERENWRFKYDAKGQRARAKLIESNLRLVVANAKKYINRGLDFNDLIEEGNLGLLRAIDKFNPNLGFKFSTYATWWIRQSITRAIADQGRTIRIPVHMVETINKLTKIERELIQELGRDVTYEEIAAKMGNDISVKRIQEIRRLTNEPISLEKPISLEDDSQYGDFVEDKEIISPISNAVSIDLKREISVIFKQCLTEREEKVIRMRYGIAPYEREYTLEEVGKEFDVTRERIRQIEAKARRKLQQPKYTRRLKEFYNK